MTRQTIVQKKVVIPFCEGPTEIMLFSFLYQQYSNAKISFRKPINLNGVRNFNEFKRKYNKRIREQELNPKKSFLNVEFLFVLDNDLDDSVEIERFLKQKGHLFQLCNPNSEGLMLSIAGKKQVRVTGGDVFKTKCKNEFEKYFHCEAHKMKEAQLKEIFSRAEIVLLNLPVLYKLFKE